MKILKMLLEKCLGQATCHAKLSDIKGYKSGGTRDSNKVDWRQGTSTS